jgi:hypothetical protein
MNPVQMPLVEKERERELDEQEGRATAEVEG